VSSVNESSEDTQREKVRDARYELRGRTNAQSDMVLDVTKKNQGPDLSGP